MLNLPTKFFLVLDSWSASLFSYLRNRLGLSFYLYGHFLLLTTSGLALASPCAVWLTSDRLQQGLAKTAALSSTSSPIFLPLDRLSDHQLQWQPVNYKEGFFVHEYSADFTLYFSLYGIS